MKTYNLKNENEILDAFKKLPSKPKTDFTAEEIFKKYKKVILTALSSGYSFEEISNLVFKPQNCKISGRQLKQAYNSQHEEKSKQIEGEDNAE